MNRWEKQQGFTIVELLIVVVVIAILAAITIVSYNGITNRANDASVQADLRTLGQQLEQYRTLGDGTLPSSIPASVSGAKASHGAHGAHYVPTTGSEYNLLYCRTSSTGDFGFVAASKSGKVFIYTNSGVKEGVGPLTTYTTTCSQNGLPAGGSWLYSNSTWLI